MQNLELSTEEAAVLARELSDITWNDRYPLSPHIRVLEEILGMLRRRACGDPASIAFCHAVALDYVSCSPYRVPIARLAAPQAALSGGSGSRAA